MGRNDMDHMQHLESVALSDCAVLQTKEGTYKGSWKRAGGGSAWFMARRNLDRLITMMAPQEYPEYVTTPDNVLSTLSALDHIVHYGSNGGRDLPGSIEATRQILSMLGDRFTAEDIFMKIRQAPGGEDGTVLACLRDARRYFMLVEAEMIAEGVVQPESETYESENYPQDIYKMIADECGVDQQEVKERIHDLFYGKDAGAKRAQWKERSPAHTLDPGPAIGDTPSGGDAKPWLDKIGAVLRVGDACTWMAPDNSVSDVEFAGVVDDKPMVRINAEGHTRVTEWERLRRDHTVENGARAKRVADGGSQHASANPLWPWHATETEYQALHKRVGAVADVFYTRRAAGVYQLEAIVGSHTCPIELAPCYRFVPTQDGPNKWVMKREYLPEELRDNWPVHQREMNDKEYDLTAPDFKFMYRWHESSLKWIIDPVFEAWARDVG